MARNIEPIVKRCRALGISPATMGYTGVSKRDSIRDPGAQKRKKKSEYALQLNEKQKVKFIYGVLERQFHTYYEKAARMTGKTGDNLLKILESRLDNVVFNLGFAMTRPEARQLVRHGHFTVNGKKVNIPSYLCRAGDVIAVKETSRSSEKFKAIMEANAANPIPKWLDVDRAAQSGRIINLPEREEIDLPIEEHLIVELYSK